MSPDHAAPALPLSQVLARLALGRDQAAWTALLVSAGPAMQGLTRRITGDTALADDALQDALLHVRDRAGRFRPSGAGDPDEDARRWVMRLTANIALKLLRTRARARRREHRHGRGPSPLPTPQEAFERAEQADLLRRELAALPAASGTAIVLHHVVGLSFDEIARELGLPVGTAKTRVRRGLIALRGRLQRAGLGLTLAAIVGGLAELPAADGGLALSAHAALLHSPLKAAAGGLAFAATKIVAVVALAAAGFALPVAWRGHRQAPAGPGLVVAFDFEDGVRPAQLAEGEVVAGPTRDGSRWCAAGAASVVHATHKREVHLRQGDGRLIDYRPGLRVTFACWTTGSVQVYVGDTEQRKTLTASAGDLPRKRWTTVSIDLARSEIGDSRLPAHPAAGDRLEDVELVAWSDGPGELYVDDVVIGVPAPP